MVENSSINVSPDNSNESKWMLDLWDDYRPDDLTWCEPCAEAVLDAAEPGNS